VVELVVSVDRQINSRAKDIFSHRLLYNSVYLDLLIEVADGAVKKTGFMNG